MTRASDRLGRRAVLRTSDVTVFLPSGSEILSHVDWEVRMGDTWALLGPNGAGKTTLLSIVSTQRFPSRGTVEILGQRLGKVDVWTLRRSIGLVDPMMRMPPELTVEEIVLTGKSGSTYPMWREYVDEDFDRVRELLKLFDCGGLLGRHPRHLSHGERGRVRVARALMTQPQVLLLDEPATGLDMLAREELLRALADLRTHQPEIAMIVVSHHVEELPASTSHAILLRGGAVVAVGEVEEALTADTLTECFGGAIELIRHGDGRWHARLGVTSGRVGQSGDGREAPER